MSWRKSTDPDCNDAELRALVLLRMMPACTDQRLTQLLASESAEALAERAQPPERVIARCERALREMKRSHVSLITIFDEGYPERLKLLGRHAPVMLFARGDLSLLETPMLAVIGARNSTEYGDSVAEQLVGDLARRGVTIVSGLARGIDGVAHRTALAVGGKTIAVLGTGIDVDYPPSHARLQQRIAEEGLLLSEFPPGTPAMRYQFPKRNQTIALLPHGLLVIEAGQRSGTRKTVDCALALGREVFAVPGPIGRYESQGTNEIIQQGAHLVTQLRDILEPLHWVEVATDEVPAPPPAHLSGAALSVYEQLDALARHVDAVARACSLSSTAALVLLTELELDGLAVQHPGKRFSRAGVQV